MSRILEYVYIGVGIVVLLTICFYVCGATIHRIAEIIERIRNPQLKLYQARKFRELAIAFGSNDKMKYIFKKVADDVVMEYGMDVWKFRDEVEEKFGRELVT